MAKLNIKSAVKGGTISGFLGALCCITPLVLVLIGLSTVSSAVVLTGVLQQNYRWTLFIPLAATFFLVSTYIYIKKREGVCNLNTIKNYKVYVITTLMSAIVVWVLLLYAIVPAIFSLLS